MFQSRRKVGKLSTASGKSIDILPFIEKTIVLLNGFLDDGCIELFLQRSTGRGNVNSIRYWDVVLVERQRSEYVTFAISFLELLLLA